MPKTLLVNLFAGPGAGKSTTMAAIFAALKQRDINAEMAPEYAKDKVWEESYRVLDNQIYVFAKQLHTIRRLMGKVDVIVTDSPILLSLHYAKAETDTFRKLVVETHHNMNPMLNVFLEREKKYNPAGRLQTENEAREIDLLIRDILTKSHVEYETMVPNPYNIRDLVFKIDALLDCDDCGLSTHTIKCFVKTCEAAALLTPIRFSDGKKRFACAEHDPGK